MAGIHLRSFGNYDCLYSNFQHIKTELHCSFQILYSNQLKSGLSVKIMHFNQVFCFMWRHLSQQEKIFLRLSSLCSLNSNLRLSCVWNCLCWQNAAVNRKPEVEAFSSWIVPCEFPRHYVSNICCYVTSTSICLLLLESLLKILL